MPIIKVSFDYYEGYLPTPRCRKLRYREVKGEHEVAIREVYQEKDFPVAMMFEKYVFNAEPNDNRHRKWIYLRWYDGRLWMLSRYNMHHAGKTWNDLTPVSYLALSLEPRSWIVGVSPEKQACVDAIEESAKDWLIFDGRLYEPCGEPMYNICTFGLGHNHAGIGTSLGVDCHYNPNLPSKWYFNAFEREKAITVAKEVAYRRGDTDSISYIENAERIEVLMPECVKANPQSWNEPGDSFLNQLEEITERTESSFEAGLMAIIMANKT